MTERNPILQSLFDRKSVRVYEEKPIPAEMKQAILEAAAQAPSAGCQQLYTILDITDPALKEALAESCDHQPFIAKAPLVLVFCADCKKWYDAYLEAGCTPRTPGVGDLMLAVTDAAIAAQNAVVAAESFGIGSCYIGDIMENCDTQRSLLHLPDYVFPAVMLVFGWPTQQQKDRVKPQRCAMEHIVHENGYRTMDGAELRDTFGYKAGNAPFDQWCTAFCNRKYNSDFSKEMTRSVEEYLGQFPAQVFDKINENFIRCSFFELCSRYLSSYYTFAIEQNNSVGCSNFEMTGIPGTNYYKDDRLVEFKYFKAKEAEHMLALNDPRPEDVAQVRAYAKDTKQKFPVYNVRSYIVYICANKGWKCWEVTE